MSTIEVEIVVAYPPRTECTSINKGHEMVKTLMSVVEKHLAAYLLKVFSLAAQCQLATASLIGSGLHLHRYFIWHVPVFPIALELGLARPNTEVIWNLCREAWALVASLSSLVDMLTVWHTRAGRKRVFKIAECYLARCFAARLPVSLNFGHWAQAGVQSSWRSEKGMAAGEALRLTEALLPGAIWCSKDLCCLERRCSTAARKRGFCSLRGNACRLLVLNALGFYCWRQSRTF